MLWGNFLGDEVPQSARLSAGGGCKSYSGNAQMPSTLPLPKNCLRTQLWFNQNLWSGIQKLEAVFHLRIWGMSETTSGAYCQQWTAIRGATCICDAVFSPVPFCLCVGQVAETEQYLPLPPFPSLLSFSLLFLFVCWSSRVSHPKP